MKLQVPHAVGCSVALLINHLKCCVKNVPHLILLEWFYWLVSMYQALPFLSLRSEGLESSLVQIEGPWMAETCMVLAFHDHMQHSQSGALVNVLHYFMC